MSNTKHSSFWSERVFPIMRVFFVQLLLMIGIIGNLAGWLIMALLVDKLHWLNIDFHGKTLNTISPDGKVLGFCILFITNLILIVLAWRYLEKKPLSAMFLEFTRNHWYPLTLGLLAGLGEVLLVFAIMTILGVSHSSWGLTIVPFKTVVLALGWILASSILGPIAEEILYRGYWFQNIQRGWGSTISVIITSMLFGGLHLLNPNAEILGAINIMLSAVIWVVGMLWFRSLWFPIGWHTAWNFAQFFIVGLPNSGISVDSMGLRGTTMFVTTLSGSRLLTGGDFGLEASIIDTIVLIGMIAGMYWLKQRRTQPLQKAG
jgi:membrane protease YdiL (CAAX protease family)